MKQLLYRILWSLPFLLFASLSFAQGISYQAVARDGSGVLQANENINVRFYILSGTANGTEEYRESHAVTTNAYALFSVIIGKGTVEAGVFDDIDWGDADHFLRVEVNGADMGTTQLETVPYSKVATAMNIDHLTDVTIGAVMIDDVLKWDGTRWVNGSDKVDDADADPTNELQTLSVNGGNLELSNGGGSVPMGSSPWTESGTDIYYDTGEVGIGTQIPAHPLHIVHPTTTTNTISIEAGTPPSGRDVLEIRVDGATPDGAQLIEMERGTSIVARVNADGRALFENVTVRENLASGVPPGAGELYANSMPLAYGYVSSNGTINQSYGIISVVNKAPGEYDVIIDQTPVGFPVVIGTSFNSSPDNEILTASCISGSNVVEINIEEAGTGTNSNFFIVVYGTPQ